jgi:hypothetical protein
VQSILRQQAVGAEAHGLGKCGGPPIRLCQPHFHMCEPPLDGADARQFLAIDAVQADDDRPISQWPAAQFGHGDIGVVSIEDLIAEFDE